MELAEAMCMAVEIAMVVEDLVRNVEAHSQYDLVEQEPTHCTCIPVVEDGEPESSDNNQLHFVAASDCNLPECASQTAFSKAAVVEFPEDDSPRQENNEQHINADPIIVQVEYCETDSQVRHVDNREPPNSCDTTQIQYEQYYYKRKRELENEAELKASKRLQHLDYEGKSLDQVIDVCLQEYAEFHEMAHTVRLKFEQEKAKLLGFVQRMVTNTQSLRQVDPLSPVWNHFGDSRINDDFYLPEDEEVQTPAQPPRLHEDTCSFVHENRFSAMLQNSFMPPRAGKGRPFTIPTKTT